MLQHYVFIRYKQDTPEAHFEEFSRRMNALPSTVPGILHLAIGRDILRDGRSWDVILIMRFKSVETLRAYQQHPAHQELMKFNSPAVAEVGSVDFFADVEPRG